MSDLPVKYLIDVDLRKQTFRLSAPVFQGNTILPQAAARLLATLPNQGTNLQLDKNKVMIIEELPFVWGPQPTLRQRFYDFIRRAQRCRHLFKRLAHIEHRQNVEDILDS